MKVLVRQDSATNTVVDVGEGEQAKAKLRQLVGEFGSGVVNEDGSPIPVEAVVAPKPKKRKAKAKPKSKKRGR